MGGATEMMDIADAFMQQGNREHSCNS